MIFKTIKNFISDQYWYLARLYTWIFKITPNRIKWFIQRGKRGYADVDVWDIRTSVSKLMVGMFKHLIKHLHSFPPNMTFEEWKSILETIIDGLKAVEEMDETTVCSVEEEDTISSAEYSRRYKIEYNKQKERLDKTFDLLKIYWLDLWD